MEAQSQSAQDAEREMVVDRLFDAAPREVFAAFVDPEHISDWWGPDGFRTTTHEMDVRPGGVWRHTMHGPDGTAFENLLRYQEVVPGERLVYTNGTPDDPEQFQGTVTFRREGEKTRVTLRILFSTAALREEALRFGAREGAHQTLARMALHVETAAGKTHFDLPPGRQEVRIARLFDAPRDRVFAAYTDPKAIPDWWGPAKYETIVDVLEPRPGGRWRFINREADGTDHGFHGVYHDVVPSERLVQTFEYEGAPGQVSLETATFEAIGDKTRVVAVAVYQSVAGREAMVAGGMEAGARETWDRLAALVAKRR